jgi:NSS family neurotransmitter:Na+ symporter
MGRERWSSKTVFIIAAIGSAVGIGNAWRFPGEAFDNGGGAFLIPYFVALLTGGLPLIIMELAIGKKFQSGSPMSFSKMSKKFEALGWWAIATSFVIISYYAVVMSWILNYLVYSINIAWKDDSSNFFLTKVLNLSEGPQQLGGISIPIFVGLFLVWVSIWFCIRNGVKSVGKVVKWTVPLPIVLLVILAVRGILLPGGLEGISYFLTPDWSALTDPSVWAAAYGQIFFSLSVLFGIMVAYASYLPKKTDITSNALVISFSNSIVSLVCGIAVFGALGYLANVNSTPISEMSHKGPFLAFATYPEAIASLPGGPIVVTIFSLMFFIALYTLAIDSGFSIVEGIVAGLVDKFGWNFRKTVVWVCVAGFSGGILFTTNAGLYWLDIIDHWINDFNLIVIGIIESILVGWIFGAKKMREYINSTSTVKLGAWWDVMIKFIIPIVLLFISISFLINNIKVNYEDYDLKWLVIGGWGMVVVTAVVAVVFGLMKTKTSPDEIVDEIID